MTYEEACEIVDRKKKDRELAILHAPPINWGGERTTHEGGGFGDIEVKPEGGHICTACGAVSRQGYDFAHIRGCIVSQKRPRR